MILKDNLYTVTSIDRDNATVDVSLCSDSIIYRAHFPQHPVTPGVCIMQMAAELLGLLQGREYVLNNVPNAKFLSILSPQETPQVSFTFSKLNVMDQGDTIKANVVATAQPSQIISAKLTIQCKAS